ncbi:RING finger protein 225 [Tachyglossus aculeatus]|uniref:RING finger protein 225 n=1 Tax=Tachyglossus aculeatus TaxID=9261 RepID=UPI0018F51111|nr:RING finger protein 225 [Tachyglossus aculeatus]
MRRLQPGASPGTCWPPPPSGLVLGRRGGGDAWVRVPKVGDGDAHQDPLGPVGRPGGRRRVTRGDPPLGGGAPGCRRDRKTGVGRDGPTEEKDLPDRSSPGRAAPGPPEEEEEDEEGDGDGGRPSGEAVSLSPLSGSPPPLTPPGSPASCLICVSPYDGLFRTPKRLACGHVFCLECLSRLSLASPAGAQVLRCPVCRRSTLLPSRAGPPALPTHPVPCSPDTPAGSVHFDRRRGVLYVRPPAAGTAKHPVPAPLRLGRPRSSAGLGSGRPNWAFHAAVTLAVLVTSGLIVSGIYIFFLIPHAASSAHHRPEAAPSPPPADLSWFLPTSPDSPEQPTDGDGAADFAGRTLDGKPPEAPSSTLHPRRRAPPRPERSPARGRMRAESVGRGQKSLPDCFARGKSLESGLNAWNPSAETDSGPSGRLP